MILGRSTIGKRMMGLSKVSYVMPVLNEAEHLGHAVESILAQDYDGEVEIVLALGPSTDGTDAVAAALSAADSRVRTVDNPSGSTPGGLNAAIRASRHPIVVRVDAHSILPREYTRIAVETIARTGAANVGGIMDAQGSTPFERAVALAYRSRVGLGGTPHHVGGAEGPAETVYLGVFDREKLLAAGLFDERIRRGQDWELNRRLRQAGGLVWFTPELRVTYRPRSSLSALITQFAHTGRWRGELVRRFPKANSLRYFVPPVMVLSTLSGLGFGIAGILEWMLDGTPSWPLLGLIVPAAYLLFVLVSAVLVAARQGPATLLWFAVVLPFIHFAWGTGFLLGLIGVTRNRHTGR